MHARSSAKTKYWNIKGGATSWRISRLTAYILALCLYHFRNKKLVCHCRLPLLKGCFVAKKGFSRNFRYPSGRTCATRFAWRSRSGFRSEQAFLIAACEHEIRQGANTEAKKQLRRAWRHPYESGEARCKDFRRSRTRRLP